MFKVAYNSQSWLYAAHSEWDKYPTPTNFMDIDNVVCLAVIRYHTFFQASFFFFFFCLAGFLLFRSIFWEDINSFFLFWLFQLLTMNLMSSKFINCHKKLKSWSYKGFLTKTGMCDNNYAIFGKGCGEKRASYVGFQYDISSRSPFKVI